MSGTTRVTRARSNGAVAVVLGLVVAVLPLASGAQECFPACRAGYSCAQGQCVGVGPVVAPQVPVVLIAPRRETPEEQARRVAEQERRDDVRRRLRVVGYLNAGYLLHLSADDGDVLLANGTVDSSGASYEETGRAASFGLGLGVRKNFETLLGVQFRFMAELLPPLSPLLGRDSEGGSLDPLETASGLAFQLSVVPSLRIGPFAHAFPMYIGLGGVAGLRFVEIESETLALSTSGAFVAGTIELGFIIGDEEKSDLGVQFVIGPDIIGVHLLFGWSFVSV